MVGMHNFGFFVNIRYADVLNLIWPITDTGTDIYVYIFPHTWLQRSSSLFCSEFTYSIIMQTLTMLACRRMQA